jgi:chemotaxis protein CheC
MVNKEFKIVALNVEEITARNASSLVGQADEKTVGIYLLFSGNNSGQLLLAFKPEIAYELVDMALGNESGTTQNMGEMERSTLGEMGNIVGTFFLNGVADGTGLKLMPSPPAVVEDMAGALLDSVLAEAFEKSDSIYAIKLLFCSATKQFDGRFLVFPTFENN